MRILGIHREHDATVCLVEDGRLVFSIEAEKDSNERYAKLGDARLAAALDHLTGPPDVVAVSGWKDDGERTAGYEGLSTRYSTEIDFLGRRARRFSSSHERSHVLSSYGLSPYPRGEPLYALVWEGTIGAFYSISADVEITRLARPLDEPGHRYAFLFELADPGFPAESRGYSYGVAGKLMALASFSRRGPITPDEAQLLDDILVRLGDDVTCKGDLAASPFADAGVTHPAVKEVAGKLSDALFDRFHAAAKEVVREPRPLIISGGCGLNCDWNSQWRDCGLFPEVFVPPCTNDTGVALGTALDAQLAYTGDAKVEWTVYAGEPFVDDGPVADGFDARPLDFDDVAGRLARGDVIAWVQGACEMGPRALGNRSILAAPFDAATRGRLNEIKGREDYRPIAPICLEEDVSEWFEWEGPSPHMLYFQRVRSPHLTAITHVDGSARAQTVARGDNEPLWTLLEAFKRRTGAGVLCNTSLNFRGRGFINRMSDLAAFVRGRGLDGMVVADRLYVPAS